MQKKISILVAAMFLCFGTVVVAQSNLSFGKSQIIINAEVGTKNIILDINKMGNENIKLQIKDASENILHSLVVSDNGAYKKRIVLADLEAQRLTFNFESTVMEYTQSIDLKEDIIQISEENLAVAYKPTLIKRGDQLLIQWVLQKPTDISVTMVDTKNVYYFEEKTKSEAIYSRILNISQIIDGEYFITLGDNKKIHTLHFIKSGVNIEPIVALR